MVKALLECCNTDCNEKAIAPDVDTIPGTWVIVTINQNLIEEDEEKFTFNYSVEFCCPEHASSQLAKISTFSIVVEGSEENV